MGEGEGPSFYTTLSETPRQQVRKEWGTGRVDPAPAGRRTRQWPRAGGPSSKCVQCALWGREPKTFKVRCILFHFILPYYPNLSICFGKHSEHRAKLFRGPNPALRPLVYLRLITLQDSSIKEDPQLCRPSC